MYGTDYTDASGLKDVVHLNEAGNKSLANGIIKELPCSIVTGLKELDSVLFEVFPNPTQDWVQWKGEKDFKVLDSQGREITSGRSKKVNLESLKNGIYHLHFNTGIKRIVKR